MSENIYTKIYAGIPLILSGSNRGNIDYSEAAKMTGLSIDQVKKALGALKGMYSRQPESTITFFQYLEKLKQSNLTLDDIGCTKGKYQACRNGDRGAYHVDSFSFKLMDENLKERDEWYKEVPKYNEKAVKTPVGIYRSITEASKELNISIETIKHRIESSHNKEWYCIPEVSKKIIGWMQKDEKRFFSCDNISEYLDDELYSYLLDEVTDKFKGVLTSLLIDIHNDPNSEDTARRLAKMYLVELFRGRYEQRPNVAAFPNENENAYKGMLVVRAEIKSVCAHHHQPVNGVCYIGIIPNGQVIGLSKYSRIAQWCARRGTLQEELTNQILAEMKSVTKSEDVAVYIEASHGCCENRGIMAKSSLTQTCALSGEFEKPNVKKEFYDNIRLQKS